MHSSTITEKGQTTIPRDVREYLHLKPQDRIVYVPDRDRIYLRLVRGSILDLGGTIKNKTKKPQDFHKIREYVKKKIARESVKELK